MNARSWRRLILLADEHAPDLGADLREALASWHREGRPRDIARYLGLGGCAIRERDGALLRAAALIARAERLNEEQCRPWSLAGKVEVWLKRCERAGSFFRFVHSGGPVPTGGAEGELFDSLLSGAPTLGRRAINDALKNLPSVFNGEEPN